MAGLGQRKRKRKRWVSALVVVFAPLLAATLACSPEPVAVTPGVSATPAPPGVPDTTQNNVSATPVLDRLGRFDGATFVPVGPGSLDTSRVIAITHGWAPGFAETYEQLSGDSTSFVAVWDPRLVDPTTGEPLAERFEQLAGALSDADPDAAVVMYSWVDQSATGTDPFQAGSAEQATEVNGHRMATAINEALPDDFAERGGELHLIGHSFGANVATTAALATATQPRQLTLFDSPEVDLARFAGAANELRYKLTRLPVGRAPGQVFVDNYVSAVGEPYRNYPGLGDVLDVALLPPPDQSGAERHVFPIGWYAQSAANPASGVGYWWSPLAGGTPETLGSAYDQPDAERPLDLVETAGPPPAGVAPGIAYPASPLVVEGGAAAGDGITLGGDGLRVVNIGFTTTADSLWLDFSVAISGSPTDTAAVFVDGRARWLGAGPDAGARPAGTMVVLYDLEPGDHTLTLVVAGSDTTGPPAAGTTARFTDFAVVDAPEVVRNADPARSRAEVRAGLVVAAVAAVALFAGVVAGIVWLVMRVRRRRRHEHRTQGAS